MLTSRGTANKSFLAPLDLDLSTRFNDTVMMKEITALPALPARAPEAHKGDFGRVLVAAGSRGMAGAAVLCAQGALRAGAGLVHLALPEEVYPIAASQSPCVIHHPL